jgi:hypothetical protein
MSDAKMIHVFERDGLGLAPFRFVECVERRGPITQVDPETGVWVSVGAPGQPMGTGAHCGQGIASCCVIESRDGKRFEVGTSCVLKTGDAGLRRDVNRAKNDARRAKKDADIAALHARIVPHMGALSSVASPTGRGSMASYLDWMMRWAGQSGQMRALKYASEALAKIEKEETR